MAKKTFSNKLISKYEIKEELFKISCSDVDYITKSGNVYCDFGNGMYLKRSCFENKVNGYIYVSIILSSGKRCQKRVHRLVAETFIEKPSDECNIVMHIDNNKHNNDISNLKWGTVSENTKQAFDDHLANNAKGFDDSQSMPIAVFSLDGNLLRTYGSVSIAAIEERVSKGAILFQAKHLVKNPNKGSKTKRYFRFLNEYLEKGFVL